jgi:cobalt-zinc-cadmium efflux system outer membrane protein
MHPFLWRLALAALAMAPARAQPPVEPPGALTLATARTLAQAFHPAIAAAQHELDAAGGAQLQAGARPNPELALLVEDTRSATRATTVQINQPIELGGKRDARLAVAGRAREQAAAALVAARADAGASAAAAFDEVLGAQDALALAVSTRDVAARTGAVADKRVAAGKASPVEATRARIGMAEADAALAQAAGLLQAARRSLAATWGALEARFGHAEGSLATPVRLPPVATLLARLEQSPRLAQLRLELDRRGAQVALERARRTPDITLSAGMKRDAQLGRDQAVFGVSIPLPLFDRNQGNLMEAASRAARAGVDADAGKADAANALLQAYDAWTVAAGQAALYRDQVLPSARSAVDATARGFEYGKFPFLDVLDAQRTLIGASERQLRAQRDARRALADIERLLGVPVSTLTEVHP